MQEGEQAATVAQEKKQKVDMLQLLRQARQRRPRVSHPPANPGPVVAIVEVRDGRGRLLRRVGLHGRDNPVRRQDDTGARCRRFWERAARGQFRGARQFVWTYPVVPA